MAHLCIEWAEIQEETIGRIKNRSAMRILANVKPRTARRCTQRSVYNNHNNNQVVDRGVVIFFTVLWLGVSANACGYNDENEYQQESFLPSGWRNVVAAGFILVFLAPNSARTHVRCIFQTWQPHRVWNLIPMEIKNLTILLLACAFIERILLEKRVGNSCF